jgi:hypothetical protein
MMNLRETVSAETASAMLGCFGFRLSLERIRNDGQRSRALGYLATPDVAPKQYNIRWGL